MTHAYYEDYVRGAQSNLGHMMDFAVNTCDFDANAFFDMFIKSGIAKEFGTGNPKYVAGMSGCELVYSVFEKSGINLTHEPVMYADKSPEFWAGWALAYYQWYSGKSFRKILCASQPPILSACMAHCTRRISANLSELWMKSICHN